MSDGLPPLRDYQAEAVEAIEREIADGRRRTLLVAPTGSGKTRILAEVVGRALIRGHRALVVAHREEIVNQLADAMGRLTQWVGIEQAARRSGGLDQIVVGSVPSLAGRACMRLERLGPFGLAVVDEAHHSTADSYQRLLRHTGCFTPGGPALIGATATPQRSDGTGLGHIFESIAYEIPLTTLVERGFLVPPRAYTIDTGTVLDRVRRRSDDYDEEDLALAVNTPARNACVVRAWQQHAGGRQTVVFAVDRRHVRDLTQHFVAEGIQAAALTGDLEPEMRAARLAAFRSKDLKVLVNCEILREGIDIPAIGAVVLARPTRSNLVLQQQVGRGLRPDPLDPSKRELIVVDLVDVTNDLGLQTMATLAGLPPRVRFQGQRVFEVSERIQREIEESPWLAAAIEANRLVTVEDILDASRPLDLLFLELPVPPEIERSRLLWVAIPPDRFVLDTPGGQMAIRQTLLAYSVQFRARGGPVELLGECPTVEEALALAERAAWSRVGPRALRMLQKDAGWLKRPASVKQKTLLDRFGVPYEPGVTAHQAHLAISRYLAGFHRREICAVKRKEASNA